jgi:hypothetical protein
MAHPAQSAESTSEVKPINPSLLLKLRLAVARHGEMDGAAWWNTRGVLGRLGKAGLSRGFPATHYFAQARIAFAVATARCAEVFNPPGCHTLWNLPPEIEDALDSHWQAWCRSPDEWVPCFELLAAPAGGSLLDLLNILEALDTTARTNIGKLKLSVQGKAVQLPGTGTPDNAALMLLAAGFSLGSKGSLTVPYLRAE